MVRIKVRARVEVLQVSVTVQEANNKTSHISHHPTWTSPCPRPTPLSYLDALELALYYLVKRPIIKNKNKRLVWVEYTTDLNDLVHECAAASREVGPIAEVGGEGRL